jgi:amino acid permease
MATPAGQAAEGVDIGYQNSARLLAVEQDGLGGDREEESDIEDVDAPKGSFHGAVFNTVNTIVGGGVLALPFVFSRVGMVLGALMLVCVAYMASFLADLLVSAAHGATELEERWLAKGKSGSGSSRSGGGNGSDSNSDFTDSEEDDQDPSGLGSDGARRRRRIGSSSKTYWSYKGLARLTFGGVWGGRAVDIIQILYLLGACVGYVIIIGDMLSPFVFRFIVRGGEELPSNPCDVTDAEREQQKVTNVLVMITVSVVVLFPIMTLQRMDSLRHTSLVAIGCITYLVGTIVVKGFLTVGKTFEDRGGDVVMARMSTDFFAVVPIVSFAFSFHFNLFPIAVELKKPEQIGWVVRTSVLICTIAYLSVGFLGYLSFLDKVEDNILLSYPLDDAMVSIGRLALGLIICFSYPVIGYSARVGFDSMVFGHRDRQRMLQDEQVDLAHVPFKRRALEAAGFVLTSLILAVLVPNISFMFGFIGATAGNFIVFVFPATFYLFVQFKLWEDEPVSGVHPVASGASIALTFADFRGDSRAERASHVGLFVRRAWRRALPALALAVLGVLLSVTSVSTILGDLAAGKYEDDTEEPLNC